ncbi:nuclear transport factor 2 family protein [Spirillospora sp. CA-255316]
MPLFPARPGLLAAVPLVLATGMLAGGCGGGDGADGARPVSPRSSAGSAGPGAGSPAVAGVDPAIGAYVAAVGARDLDALAAAFAPDARVVDVSRTISGRAAIRAWARAEVIGGALRVLSVMERRPDGQRLLVHWAPSGSPGWRAHYDFTVARGLITGADLQYA